MSGCFLSYITVTAVSLVLGLMCFQMNVLCTLIFNAIRPENRPKVRYQKSRSGFCSSRTYKLRETMKLKQP